MVFHINMAGNIGAGKSCLFEAFILMLEGMGVKVFRLIEDVAKMSSVQVQGEDINPLELSYTDPKRYKASAQLYFYMLRYFEHLRVLEEARKYEEEHPGETVLVVSERSGDDDFIFYRFGWTDSDTMDRLDCVNYEMARQMRPLAIPDLTIYVRTSPVECYRRTRGRGRKEDKGVPLDVLKGLHNLHEQVYAGVELDHPVKQESVDPSRVIILENDAPVDNDKLTTTDHPLLAELVAHTHTVTGLPITSASN